MMDMNFDKEEKILNDFFINDFNKIQNKIIIKEINYNKNKKFVNLIEYSILSVSLTIILAILINIFFIKNQNYRNNNINYELVLNYAIDNYFHEYDIKHLYYNSLDAVDYISQEYETDEQAIIYDEIIN